MYKILEFWERHSEHTLLLFVILAVTGPVVWPIAWLAVGFTASLCVLIFVLPLLLGLLISSAILRHVEERKEHKELLGYRERAVELALERTELLEENQELREELDALKKEKYWEEMTIGRLDDDQERTT